MLSVRTERPQVATTLDQRWEELRQREPRLRQRDGAARLGVSEAALVAAHAGESAVRLSTDWKGILGGLELVGPVIGLTRNAHAVIEKQGTYGRVEIDGGLGMVLDAGIELRLFLARWHVGFAVREETACGPVRSLQFFDADGEAVHKLALGEASNRWAFEALVDRFEADDQGTAQALPGVEAAPPEHADAELDVAALRRGWDALENRHGFVRLLHQLGATPLQALRLAGPERARPVALAAHRRVFERAALAGLPLQVTVGNRGTRQLHRGPVRTLRTVDGWFNGVDPGSTLHLHEEGIASAWVVRTPTREGGVSRLELYDRRGNAIASVEGHRPPGQPEHAAWRDLLTSLEPRAR